jgi:hypothetical protein
MVTSNPTTATRSAGLRRSTIQRSNQARRMQRSARHMPHKIGARLRQGVSPPLIDGSASPTSRTYWRAPFDAPSHPREPSGSATEPWQPEQIRCSGASRALTSP